MGKGKEYNAKGKILFEGEYLNGQRWNGKFKEFNYFNQLIPKKFGYYINGEKIVKILDSNENKIYGLKSIKGIIKQYGDYDILIYGGEYSNGKRNGKGKEYNNKGELIFEGEYLNGQRWNGIGKEYFKNELTFEGEYSKGEKLGKTSNILNDVKTRNGYLIEYYSNGNLKFEGEYINGKRNGKGKEYNDKGKLIFEGEYLYDYKLKGKLFIKENLEYEGEFLCNKKWNGKGFDENGNEIYELKNGKGKVKEYNLAEELKYEGENLKGRRNGKGKEFNKYGNIIFEGNYLNGERCKEKNKE